MKLSFRYGIMNVRVLKLALLAAPFLSVASGKSDEKNVPFTRAVNNNMRDHKITVCSLVEL